MRTLFAGMVGMAMMFLSGCTVTIVNHDDLGSALNYTVTQDGNILAQGQLAINQQVTVDVPGSTPVNVEGVAVVDGFTGEIDVVPVPGDTTVTWTSGFTLGAAADAKAKANGAKRAAAGRRR
jgi:hypothetical protein